MLLQSTEVLYQALGGSRHIDGMYLFHNTTGTAPSVPSNATASYFFSNASTFGGILRTAQVTPAGSDQNTMSFISSSAGAESYGASFTDGRKVYAIALVMRGLTKEEDLVLSYTTIDAVTKAANAEITAKGVLTV